MSATSKWSVIRPWLGVCIALGATACGSSGGSEAADSGVTAMQAAAAQATAYCAELAKCQPIELAEQYGTMASCTSSRTLLQQNALAASGTGATPQTSEACTAAYATEDCADFVNGNPPAACRPQVGMGTTGAACAFAAQCQSAFCQVSTGSICGTCQPSPAAGSSCATTNCPTGLHCAASTQTCVSYGTAGSACVANGDCGYQLDCVGADATTHTSGKCTAELATVGATCDHALKTGPGCDPSQNLICGKDDKCDSYDTATTGEPCAYVANDGGTTYTYCTGGAKCLVSKAVGTCVGPTADGMACDTASDNDCLPPAVCVGTVVDGGVTGTCQIQSASSCH